MNLNELQDKWKIDCVIEDDLGAAAIRTPMLHSYYLNELVTAKLKLTKTQHELAELTAAKARYFRGEMTKAELDDRKWVQWQHRSLKSDIEGMTEAEADIQLIHARENYMKTMIYFLESVLGEIKNRNWNVRASLDWQRFRAGN